MMDDLQLCERHGDHPKWSIKRWRDAIENGETDLEYIDWRADRLWCAAMGRSAVETTATRIAGTLT